MNAPQQIAPERASPALAPLHAELERLDLLLEREILRLRTRYELSLDEFRGLYISDRHVDELLRSRSHEAQPPLSEQLTAAAQAKLAAVEASGPAGASPWSQLAQALRLTRPERDLVLAALAPELDPKYETLFAYLNNDVTRKWPTPDLAGRLFGATAAERVALRARLVPDALLPSSGVLETAPGSRDLARGQRGFRVAPPLADWLLGLPYSDERLSGAARLIAAPQAVDWLPAGTRALLAGAARVLAAGGPAPIFACTASEPAEAVFAAQQLLALARQPTLLLDLRTLRAAPAHDLVAAVNCLSAVFRVSVIAAPLDALYEHDGRPAEAAETLRRLLGVARTLVLAGTPAALQRAFQLHEAVSQRVLELRLPEPSAAERAAVWSRLLEGRASTTEIRALADRFALGAERIAQAVRVSEYTAAIHGESALESGRLFDAARAVSAVGSEHTTRSVSTPFGWDDLVVPAAVRGRLRDVLRAVELRPRVLDEWGFARRMSGARGVKVMFAGASGTGKTMAAAILAKSLALELHRIELAAVVSKYIGETEKNLDRAFDAARRANAILFIDEADALFGKRSEVKDAHDRYANVETAYLLQKMEDHDGVVILATNLANNIDEAFSRRMHFVVDFPLPDIVCRENLWRGMFPPDAPLAADVDFAFLARQFTLAGGDIRNIVLDAAYRAAQEEQPIGMQQLVRAVARQYAKRGKVPGQSEFREYFGLLSPAAG